MNANSDSDTKAEILKLLAPNYYLKPLYHVVKLGIIDLIANGTKSTAQLAQSTDTLEPVLYRILRALSTLGLFRELPDRAFELTPLGAALKNEPGSMRNTVLWLNDPRHEAAWGELDHCLKTGEPAVEKVFGDSIFGYLAKTPDLSEIFNLTMIALSTQIGPAVASAYDFSSFKTVLDLGGGYGALISAILLKNPGLKGILFDLPNLANAAREHLKTSGLTDRCSFTSGDFFKSVPTADAITVSRVLHDWTDDQAIQILKSCRTALPNSGKVLIVERIVPPPNQSSRSKLLDLELLVTMGGRERTETEFRSLLESAKLNFCRVIHLSTGHGIIEAQKIN